MYLPPYFAGDDEDARALLTGIRAADLVTATPDGPRATYLPLLPDLAGGRLLGHLARANDQWRQPVLGRALVVVHDRPDAYVSPGWYASKREHGRVVPTWDYVLAHVHAEVTWHHDAEWLEAQVRALTERHEAHQQQPWSVDDAPPAFVAGQLRGIVGVELRVTRVEVKHKLSQNRSAADVAGVVDGLTALGDTVTAEAVRTRTDQRQRGGAPA